MLLLPSELKSLIAEQLVSSPNSLAALARTHSAYQREAEKALYNTFHLEVYVPFPLYLQINDSLKVLETLATNSERAALVRFLNLEYGFPAHIIYNKHLSVKLASSYLFKSLINMHSLSDFRVRPISFRPLTQIIDPEGEAAETIKGLGRILCEGHFRLQTLFCHEVFNISQIIKSQPELQILGLYTTSIGNPSNILTTLKELHNAQLFLPIVLTLEFRVCQENFRTRVPNRISIFPVFYSVDRWATIPQTLAQSVFKDQASKYRLAEADYVCEHSIYLIDSSDMPSISALAKDMTVSFPQIKFLDLCFERRCEITSQEIKEEFSFFSNLHNINTSVWPQGGAGIRTRDV